MNEKDLYPPANMKKLENNSNMKILKKTNH